MRELIETAIVCLRSNLLVNFAIALIAGGAACRSITSDRLSGSVVYCLIGITGLFLSQLLFIHFISSDPLSKWATFVYSFTFAPLTPLRCSSRP